MVSRLQRVDDLGLFIIVNEPELPLVISRRVLSRLCARLDVCLVDSRRWHLVLVSANVSVASATFLTVGGE